MECNLAYKGMIFAVQVEMETLFVFSSARAAISHCEGLDVEAAIWLFWDEAGHALAPEFSVPNKRGVFTVKNGVYHLVPAGQHHHAPLLEALEHMKSIEPNDLFKSVEDVHAYLTHRAPPSAMDAG